MSLQTLEVPQVRQQLLRHADRARMCSSTPTSCRMQVDADLEYTSLKLGAAVSAVASFVRYGHRVRSPLAKRQGTIRVWRTASGGEVSADVAIVDDDIDGEDSGDKHSPFEPSEGVGKDSEEMHSPFEASEGAEDDENKKRKLPLTPENVDMVLDELRPYLQNDGGDCKIVEIDGPIVKLEMQGSCSSCSASSVTLKMGIEKTLMERIPEIAEVVSVMPDEEPLSEAGIEEVLNGIRPFLSVSGGAIDLGTLDDGANPQIILEMSGPPLKSMAVRVEVINRIKRKFPQVQDVEIVAAETTTPTSEKETEPKSL